MQHLIVSFVRSVCQAKTTVGFQIAFLVFECAAYLTWAPGRVEHHAFSKPIVIDNRILANKVIVALPFDIPTSLYGSAIQLASVQDTPDFLRFVRRRQKVRAVCSLVTSVRKQMSYMGVAQLQMADHHVDDHFDFL